MPYDNENSLIVNPADFQKGTLKTLILGVVPAGAAITSAYSASAVLGEELTGSETLGALAAACMTTGAALSTIPLARIMAAKGRRPGIVTGYAMGLTGAVLAMFAAIFEIYFLLPLGILGVGAGNGANLAARFAATDLVSEENRAGAIGNLVWASTVGSVLGPTLGLGPAKKIGEFFVQAELAGPYIAAALCFGLAAFIVHRRLRPDPLIVSDNYRQGNQSETSFKEAFSSLFLSKAGRLAIGSMASGHIVMVGVMTMTPLHLKDGGHQLELVGFVISLHVIGMYAFSPVVGWLSDKLGAKVMMVCGGLMLFIGSELASHSDPEDSLGVFLGLFLIGLGWSFGLISSSSLLVEEFTGPERVKIQGVADLFMTTFGGIAGLGSGFLVSMSDYQSLSHYSGLLGLYPVAAVLFFSLTRKNLDKRINTKEIF